MITKTRWAAIAAGLFTITTAHAGEAGSGEVLPPTAAQQYVQAWLGTADADDAWSLEDSDGETLGGDYDNLPWGGGVAQRVWGNRAQYGFEGGGIVAWQNDDIEFASRNGALFVATDTEFVTVDLFMGGVVAVRPTEWLRLYAAGGPSLAWGHLRGDDDDDEDEDDEPDDTTVVVRGPGSIVVIDSDSDNDWSFSAYARAGLEIELASGFTFGASVRYTEHEFDFGSRGQLELDEVQWFLTLGTRL